MFMEDREDRQIIKFENSLNEISMQGVGFTEVEYRLFWYICYKALDKGTDVVTISFQELKESTYLKKNYTKVEFKNVIKQFYDKLKNFEYVSDECDDFGNIKRFIVFYGYETHFENDEMEFKVTKDAQFIFNALSKNFTMFEYKELLRMKTIEGINLFRLLKQWRTVGKVSFTLEEIKKYMGFPKDMKTKEVTRRISKAVEDLKKRLPVTYDTLAFEPVKRGKTITGYKFEFRPEARNELQGKNLVETRELPVITVPVVEESAVTTGLEESSDNTVSTYEWGMPDIDFGSPTEEYRHKFDKLVVDEKDIIESWNITQRENYLDSLRVITPEFNKAVFEAKLGSYYDEMMELFGERKLKQAMDCIYTQIRNVNDPIAIYAINNMKTRATHAMLHDVLLIVENTNICNPTAYYKSVFDSMLKEMVSKPKHS